MPAAVLSLLLALTTLADPIHLRTRAEAAFAEGVALRGTPEKARSHFRRAADLYEELRRRGAANAALFLNQGNACLLADDLPGAVLAYRRGLRLVPNDRRLQAQLTFARAQVEYPHPGRFARPPVERRPPWLPRLAGTASLPLAAVLYAAGWVAVTRWRMVRRGSFRVLAASAFVLAALLGGGLAFEASASLTDERRPPVVVAHDGVLLRRGNGEAYPRRSDTPLNRGVEARLLFDRGNWAQIELSGREVGWVPCEYVLIDRP